MDMTIRHKSFRASLGFQQYSIYLDALIPLFEGPKKTARVGLG